MRVLIAGGGIGALEALLELEMLAGDRVDVEVVAPAEHFVYRPHLVAEPFSRGAAVRIDLAQFAGRHGARARRDTLVAVDPALRSIGTGSGDRLDYDALLIATGAHPVAAVDGALTFDDRAACGGAFREVLDELEAQGRGRLVFAVPAEVLWSLPVYELALLSAAHLRDRGGEGIEIVVATREARPLALLGEDAPGILAGLLIDAGIELRSGSAPVRFADSVARARERRGNRRGPRRRHAGARGPDRFRASPSARHGLHPCRRTA